MRMINIGVSKIENLTLRRLAIVVSFPFIAACQVLLCIWAFMISILLNLGSSIYRAVIGSIYLVGVVLADVVIALSDLSKSAAEQWRKT
jgi:hypothetical protein